MEYKAIKTEEVGYINGRDAVFLDEFKQIFNDTQNCIFKGTFNTKKIESEMRENDYLQYILSFKNVVYYQCCELDTYINEVKLDSSFDMIDNSNLIKDLKNGRQSSKVKKEHKHYVFATYDYVYDIIATDYNLEI
jgi:hypothetical protein